MQVWHPIILCDIERLEKVQQRATKIPTKLSKISNDQRLAQLGKTSIKDRRVRGDLIQMFKIMKGLEVVKWEKGFKPSFDPPLFSVMIPVYYESSIYSFIVGFNCIENYLGSINERCNHSSLKFFNIINEIELTIGHLNFEKILSFVMNSKSFIIIIKNLLFLNFKISKIQNLIEKAI